MEKVRPWCGQPSDRGRLRNRNRNRISKLFELVLMSIREDCFVVDPLQFGFKRNTGCPDAIFTLKCTVQHFTRCGGSVCAASLNIRKAFDRVNHYKLFCSLLSYGVPWVIMVALCNGATIYYIFIYFALWFLLSFFLFSFFFPRLISAVAEWMSVTLAHMVWP